MSLRFYPLRLSPPTRMIRMAFLAWNPFEPEQHRLRHPFPKPKPINSLHQRLLKKPEIISPNSKSNCYEGTQHVAQKESAGIFPTRMNPLEFLLRLSMLLPGPSFFRASQKAILKGVVAFCNRLSPLGSLPKFSKPLELNLLLSLLRCATSPRLSQINPSRCSSRPYLEASADLCH